MEQVIRMLDSWIADGQLPGAALRVMHKGEVVLAHDAGVRHRESGQPVNAKTLFDLASLTKVTATLPAILQLLAEKRFSLDERLARFFPECPEDKREITVRHLLTHTSGLPADLTPRRRDEPPLVVPELVFAQPLLAPPGTQVVYSDLGMILLGLIVEKITGMPLDRYVQERIFQPLGMVDTCFRPAPQRRGNTAATEYCSIRHAYICGDVHDEKAFLLGGVAGHAGLFATADDLLRYSRFWLYGNEAVLPRAWRETAGQCWTRPLNGSRGLGWESNWGESIISCGRLFGRDSFGHTGFTGTSLWIDPQQEVAVVFLTNAVHLGRDHALRQLRPVLHDAVMAHLVESDNRKRGKTG